MGNEIENEKGNKCETIIVIKQTNANLNPIYISQNSIKM